jgi:hypothetical protein
MRKSIAVLLLAPLAALAHAPLAHANVIAPTGLAPGSQYLLIFATSDVHEAVDEDIDVYNLFVTNEAAQGVPFGLPSGLTWRAVASTDDVDANVNAPSGALPVYNTAGQQVAGPGVGIYTGVLDNPVGFDQFGDPALTAQEENVWTGSDYQGFGIPGLTLGNPSGEAEIGRLATDATWLQFGPELQYEEVPFSKSFYALSSAITVPIPEPATITLLAAAFLMIAAHLAVRQRR